MMKSVESLFIDYIKIDGEIQTGIRLRKILCRTKNKKEKAIQSRSESEKAYFFSGGFCCIMKAEMSFMSAQTADAPDEVEPEALLANTKISRLQFAADNSFVFNPSAEGTWIRVNDGVPIEIPVGGLMRL